MKLQPNDIMQLGDVLHYGDDGSTMVIRDGYAGELVSSVITFGGFIERPGPEPAPTLMVDKCPSCGSTGTLFIGAGGYLTCSLIGCPQPGVGRAIAQLHEHVRILREALEDIAGMGISLDPKIYNAEDAILMRKVARAALEATK